MYAGCVLGPVTPTVCGTAAGTAARATVWLPLSRQLEIDLELYQYSELAIIYYVFSLGGCRSTISETDLSLSPLSISLSFSPFLQSTTEHPHWNGP